MDLLSKYASVFQLGEKFKIKNGKIAIVDGKINLQGVVNILFEQKQLCKKIKSIGGEKPNDFVVDITVINKDYYHLHRVKKGETLSIILKKYYLDSRKYIDIYDANRDQISHPDEMLSNLKIIIPNV